MASHPFSAPAARDTPAQRATAVAIGVFIASTPLVALRGVAATGAAQLLSLDPRKVQAAARSSGRALATILIASELALGGWLRRGTLWPGNEQTPGFVLVLLGDLLFGALVFGTVLSLAAFLAVRVAALDRDPDPARDALIADATDPYLQWGLSAWGFANGKLRRDPVYLNLLASEILPHHGRLLDLGCGPGLTLACLSAARKRHRCGQWPTAWAPPPADLALYGIEHRAHIAHKAQRVLGAAATVVHGDIRDADLPRAAAALLLDVLHLIPFAEQETIVNRTAGALEPGGLLLIREADKCAGWGFTAVRAGNWLTAVTQLDPVRRFYFRSAEEWRALVESCGLTVRVRLMGEGTPFANVLIEARKSREQNPVSGREPERKAKA